jgi:hypothetical protein
MKTILTVLTLTILYSFAYGKKTAYQGSTPACAAVREFLDISRADSIDFIRWELVLNGDRFSLDCNYGLSKPNTDGFIDGKRASFSGTLNKKDHLYELRHGPDIFYVLEINGNLVHLLDKNKDLLKGNGGWSYTLNNIAPTPTSQFFYPVSTKNREAVMAFEGRTPCDPLSEQIGRGSAACYKLKWYMILFTDPATGKPSHYLMGGTAYRKVTMQKGNWDIIKGKDGRTIYRLDPEKKEKAIHLLTADNTILLFTSPDGSPLVGNEDFSFTLSRTVDREKH